MVEKVKRKSPSIRALEELHDIIKEKCLRVHGRVTSYGSIDRSCNTSSERTQFESAKQKIIKKISKELEEYAIKKYSQYGLISVPVCHRSSSSGDDRLEIDLKMKQFPEAQAESEAFENAEKLYQADLKAVDEWYFQALQSVALKEDLPEVPVFSKT
jgi:hypothetical protein